MSLWQFIRNLFVKEEEASIEPQEPTYCYGITEKDAMVSVNPCLAGPYTHSPTEATKQMVPYGWDIHNWLVNADKVADEYSALAKITANNPGITFHLHNSVVGIDGKWGYSQDMILKPGCYLLKVSGKGWINDPLPGHDQNFIISGHLEEELLSQQVFPRQEGFELIFPFAIVEERTYNVRFMLEALWATAGHGSMVDIHSAAVLSVGEGFCE